jgi:hypothetical protein
VNAFKYAFLSLVGLFWVPVFAQPQSQDSEQVLAAIFPGALDWQAIEGTAKTIETRFGRLSIESSSERCPGTGERTPVAQDSCEAAYATLVDCVQRGRGKDYYAYSLSECLRLPESVSTASRRPLLGLSNHPGFSGDAHMNACGMAARTGEEPGCSVDPAGRMQ